MKNIKYISLVIGLLIIDQLSKFIVSQTMVLYQENVIIKDFFSLYYIRNDGAAFSIFKGQIFFFYLITIVGLIIVYFLFKSSTTKLSKYACMILVAGILGNFIDRLLFKEVIDFFSFTFFSYDFAIFNMADVYISCAVVLILIDSLFYERRQNNGKSNNSQGR